MMIKQLNWKQLFWGVLTLSVSHHSMAVNPGVTQQAIGNIQPAVSFNKAQQSPHEPEKPISEKQKKELLEKLFKNKAFKEYFLEKLKHPSYSETPKSVFTPVGTPMRWGGVGIAGNVANRYPSQRHDSYDTAFSAALPFGNSETSIGGALAVGSAQLGPSPVPKSNTRFGQQGSVGLTFSRWLATGTIATAGVANLIPWGTEARLSAKSYYGGLTQVFSKDFQGVSHPISVSIGLGSGGFTPIGELDQNGFLTSLRDNKASVFANASINLTPQLALIGDYYSETFAAGMAYNTVIVVPMSVMLYAGNLRHTSVAPSTSVGLRIAAGLPLPGQ